MFEVIPMVIDKSLDEMKSDLKEKDCELFFEWNDKLDAWNGYLRLIGDQNGFIKVFIYDKKEEAAHAALEWASEHPRHLKFYNEK